MLTSSHYIHDSSSRVVCSCVQVRQSEHHWKLLQYKVAISWPIGWYVWHDLSNQQGEWNNLEIGNSVIRKEKHETSFHEPSFQSSEKRGASSYGSFVFSFSIKSKFESLFTHFFTILDIINSQYSFLLSSYMTWVKQESVNIWIDVQWNLLYAVGYRLQC